MKKLITIFLVFTTLTVYGLDPATVKTALKLNYCARLPNGEVPPELRGPLIVTAVSVDGGTPKIDTQGEYIGIMYAKHLIFSDARHVVRDAVIGDDDKQIMILLDTSLGILVFCESKSNPQQRILQIVSDNREFKFLLRK